MSAPLVVPLPAGAPPAPDEGAQPLPQYAPVTGAPFPVNGGGPAPAAQTAPRPAQQTSTSTATPLTAEDYSALIDRKVQRTLDMLAPYQLYRWLGLAALMGLFFLRMFYVHGFYIITYVLLIFILNQFILFLQPKDRASLLARRSENTEAAASEAGPAESDPAALPTYDAEEFRPFVRRLPEFQMWHSVTVATFCSIFATFFPVFNIPVFWPVLVFYFILLFVATMRRQWLDMKRLKYVPWDIGAKKTYKSDPKKVSVKPRDAASMARAQMDSAVVSSPGSGPAGPGGASPPVPTLKRTPTSKQSVA